MAIRWLKLNDDKTELTISMSAHHQKTYGQCDITIGESTISPASHVHNLGVEMDSHLSMSHQVSAICKSCSFHLYRLSTIRRYLTVEATRNAVQVLITSRFDDCNSLLAAITSPQVNQLQNIQNQAARLVTRSPRLLHITPVLAQIYRLPMECRIQFKTLVMVFKCLHSEAPLYLCDLLQPGKVDSRLRSDSAIKLYQPIARKQVGERAFSVTAPKLWSNLPTDLRNLNAVSAFKRKLKTHFFRKYFN